MLGLIVLNGLSTSPRVEYKFKSQNDDPVNGSDLVCASFGENAMKRYKLFKLLFAIQDPMIPVPSQKHAPNHKVDHFFSHLLNVSSDAFSLGRNLSSDEQDASFQGRHEDKARVTFKRAGDGFLIDAICEDGYTYSFYPRNVPPPKRWVDKGYSPTHSRILFMLESLPDQYYTCGMDNLFISAKFLRGAYTDTKSKTMIHGVCRTSGRGLPECVLQVDLSKDRNKADRMRGETKAAVLEGDADCPSLVAYSVYDSKPVHFLSMAADKLVWDRNERSVYDKAQRRVVKMPFYRTSIQNFYNHHMNSVDVADQLRGSYNFQHWMRNRKWWWALFMWGFGVLLVNAYILYKTAHLYIWCQKKEDILSQYEFRKEVALSWINVNAKSNEENPAGSRGKRSAPSVVVTESVETRGSKRQRQQTKKSKKAPRVNDKTLHPIDGALRCRLNTNIHHLPDGDVNALKKRSLRCALHRWQNRSNEYKYKVMICQTCRVPLCLWCYSAFHQVKHVEDLKIHVETIVQKDAEYAMMNRSIPIND